MKPEIVVMNFSHAYEEERFIRNSRFRWIDCTDIGGTSGYEDRIRFFSGAELSGEEGWREFSSLHISDPVYVSVDKDVLDPRYAATGWDQGSMPLPELESLLGIIFRNEKVIGVDVCGECSHSLDIFDEQRVGQINGHANAELLSLYLRCA